MIEIWGKQVRDTLEELLDPAVSALLVIDMQVGSVTSDGAIARAGQDLSMMPTVVERCAEAIASARRLGVAVIHVRVANLPGGASSPPGWLRACRNVSGDYPLKVDDLSVEGDPSSDFCDECRPEPGEIVVTKRRPSAFFNTDLAVLLRAQGIETVAVIGVSTGGCVEATLRDATHHDFYAVLIEDAVGAYDTVVHDAALVVMRARHDHCTLEEATAAWGARAEVPTLVARPG